MRALSCAQIPKQRRINTNCRAKSATIKPLNDISEGTLRLNLLFSILLAACAHVLPAAQPPDATWTRADELVKKMTLDEKIDYIGGTGASIRAIPRLGIPEIVMSDGPMGCRCFGKAADLPGGIALAATWNTDLAREVGTEMGRQCRARGVHILLGPAVNIYRSPLCGRNFEYMGEDPFLASSIVVPEIEGIQSQGVLATIKHFACNNQEWNRYDISSEVDERTMQEIYFPAFKAAVQKAKSGCLMCAYNLVNGAHCTENDYLLDKVLKRDWGFDGIIMSDWGATHNAIPAANAGLDLEMPCAWNMNREKLEPAIKAGLVKESTIDEKVRRILRTIIAAGFMDRPQTDSSIPLDDPKDAKVALKGALESLVLLKNEGNALPLDRGKIKSVVVMGPNAHPAVYCGGGSAFAHAFHSTSIADGFREVAGNVEVRLPAGYLDFDGPEKMELFDNKTLQGTPVYTTQTSEQYFWWHTAPVPELADKRDFSARWSARIRPSKSGRYTLCTRAGDGTRVFVDGKSVIDSWSLSGYRIVEGDVDLAAGEHDVRVEYSHSGGDAEMFFGWRPFVSDDDIGAYVKDADAVVYCAGFCQFSEAEDYDRPYELPESQLRTIQALARANKRVIVVLNDGGSVCWDGWLDKVQAVVEAWYPGQEVGLAVAKILFGDVNPSGKLPASFEKKWEDNPSSPYYKINDHGKTPYTEGIFAGYRGFDKSGKEPRFCFGHGLSYTTFKFSPAKVSQSGSGSGKTFEVTCDVTNTGDRAGAQVAQLYVGQLNPSVPRPVRELKGFSKVMLQPNQTKQVSFEITKDDLAFFDAKTHKWVTERGAYEVWVGDSSRSLPLHTRIEW